MKNTFLAMLLSCALTCAIAQSTPGMPEHDMNMPQDHAMEMHHNQGAGIAVSYDELTKTAALLEQARRATEKYRDVRTAEAEGYHAIGPDVRGMGIHYVGGKSGSSFDVAQPPILLYEKNPQVEGGFQLIGVSYLFNAPEGPDGQPLNAPFPKALAQWHRHENLCVLADRSVRAHVTENECTSLGGNYTAETQWMVHAWIWKDSPTGVFAPTNPTVQ